MGIQGEIFLEIRNGPLHCGYIAVTTQVDTRSPSNNGEDTPYQIIKYQVPSGQQPTETRYTVAVYRLSLATAASTEQQRSDTN
jgi:hypothetical protein